MDVYGRSGMEAWKASVEMVRSDGIEGPPGMRAIQHLCVKIGNPLDLDLLLAQVQGVGEYPTAEELELAVLTKRMLPGISSSVGMRMLWFANAKDQLHGIVIPLLKKDGSRRAVMSFVDPFHERDKFPLEQVALEIKDGRLVLTGILGPCDVLLGWPSLIFQLRKLQEYVGSQLGVQTGSLTTWCSEAYVLEKYLEGFA